MPLHVSSTMCSSSVGQKLYYTASGVITHIGGRTVHRCTCAPDGHLQSTMIPDAV